MLNICCKLVNSSWSHSLRSAWIEMCIRPPQGLPALSHSLRSAWIEISSWLIAWSVANPSHSLRSAWIEIRWRVWMLPRDLVALLTECVDRNVWADAGKEGCVKVALLTECVDRNRHSAGKRVNSYLSHSLRSAWIEIAY